MKKDNINEKFIQPPPENNLAQIKNENLILDKKEDEPKLLIEKPLEEVNLKQNTKTFGKNPVEVKEVKIISFKESLKKNFNLQKYEKMESNIAWVKIIAILLVVLTHTIQSSLGWASANGGSIMDLYKFAGNNAYALHFFQILSIPCVNLFVIVSCFLENKSIKIKFYKLFKMYLLITFILLMFTVFKWAIWPQKISVEEWVNDIIWFYIEDPWYFTAYFAFLLIVPFVNYMFKKLTLNGINVAFIVVIIVFLLWKFLAILFGTGLWDGATGIVIPTKIKDAVTNRGYNVINFLVIYVIVQWLIAHNFFARWKWWGWLIIYVVTFGLQYLMIVWTYSSMVYEYSNPLVILSALSIFGIFYNFKIKKNVFVNYISTLTMYIFLFHWNALGKTFISFNQSNADLGNLWLSNIMQTLMYQKTVFLAGLWVGDPTQWPAYVLLVFVVLALVLIVMSIIFDFICRFVTAIPWWQKSVNWIKDLMNLDRFENLFIKDDKPVENLPTAQSK
ncbi:MAG: acyltransferase [Malacoplasma sp.]|nr:acyltransferase [Malacoplasma sp.]